MPLVQALAAEELANAALALSAYQAATDADEVDLGLIEALLQYICQASGTGQGRRDRRAKAHRQIRAGGPAKQAERGLWAAHHGCKLCRRHGGIQSAPMARCTPQACPPAPILQEGPFRKPAGGAADEAAEGGQALGAVLIFLPGWDEIVRLKDRLEGSPAFGSSRCGAARVRGRQGLAGARRGAGMG